MTTLPAVIGETIAGAMSEVLGHVVPGGSLLALAIDKALEPARRRATDEIVEALRRGGLTLEEAIRISPQATVPMLLRYFRAAEEGAARLNLRLMAEVLAGMISQAPIYPSRFVHLADILASLRREEVLLLATLHRNIRIHKGAHHGSEEETLKAAHKAIAATQAELVPSVFPTKEIYQATAVGCTRTGLLIETDNLFGHDFTTSPLMDALAELASLEQACRDFPNEE